MSPEIQRSAGLLSRLFQICQTSNFSNKYPYNIVARFTLRKPYLIGVCDQQCSLLWEIVINIGNYLHGYICLPCTRRSYNLTKQEKNNC